MTNHPYFGQPVALVTLHEKDRVIAPLLADSLKVPLQVVRDFDTDALGTFTREVPRFGTQKEAALKKARIAVEKTGLPLGLGSEGSFAPGPFGVGTFNLEMVAWVDVERDLEVIGYAQGPGLHHHDTITSFEALQAFAQRAEFPAHGLVLRPNDEHGIPMEKGLCNDAQLRRAFESAQKASSNGRVFVENDLRAHVHPSRMANIEKATRDLLSRILSLCPTCQAPGFGPFEQEPGLPCEDCGTPTRLPKAEVWACVKCPQSVKKPIKNNPLASARHCDVCNP